MTMKALLFLASALCFGLLASCSSYTELGYQAFERDLGGGNELSITTYPAGFPTETGHTPYVSSTMKSADKVYFQVHIRDAKKKPGPNLQVKSATIHSFDCIIANKSWTPLIRDFNGSFWMQGNPNYDTIMAPPIPRLEDGVVRIRIDFSVNGKRQQFEGPMPASSKTTPYPLFLRNKGI